MSENIPCHEDPAQREVICILPITFPTSKVRIKRDGIEPVAPRRDKLDRRDYIEWQISYWDNKENPIEFGEIIILAHKNGKISKDEICSIIKEYGDPKVQPFNEQFKIKIFEEKNQKIYKDFNLLFEKTPILHLELDDGCYIRVTLRHKQRAVGYQSMVYIYIPVQNLRAPKPLVGRTAAKKEEVSWVPNKIHILGLLKAFLIASYDHRNDIKKLIRKYIGACE
ncbi:MAG: R.Pab1 family restriction endonuclease [Thermofilum sp.]|jgi:hypothetical protein|nr:R.Pab1 family restriction endonuclease [Thermofilum sp.]